MKSKKVIRPSNPKLWSDHKEAFYKKRGLKVIKAWALMRGGKLAPQDFPQYDNYFVCRTKRGAMDIIDVGLGEYIAKVEIRVVGRAK